jgi:hypothetical protein
MLALSATLVPLPTHLIQILTITLIPRLWRIALNHKQWTVSLFGRLSDLEMANHDKQEAHLG